MKKENIFYLILVLTILVIRTWVFFFPLRRIIISGVLINHFWLGIILILFSLLLPKKYLKLRVVAFPIGLGLIIDELIFIILGGGTVNDYWSIYSLSGVIILMVIVFILRSKFVKNIL